MKKVFALVLALAVVLSVFPVGAAALNWSDFTKIEPNPDRTEAAPYVGTKLDGTQVNISQKDYEALREQYKAHVEHEQERLLAANHPTGEHKFNGYGSNTKYHWLQCACGCQISMEPHVDPKDAVNDYCICGYQFSDNADLVTLWVKDCPVIKNFNKNTTEYTLKAYTYKDVKEIQISTGTFDSEATVELPEDLTLKDGENKFEVKVTSENQKVTKIYTIIVNKEAKK